MSAPRTYVLGAGVAGLAAATRLAEAGRAVTLIEAAPQPGGRCRSHHDALLDAEIDNGNHLVLSGNTDAMRYLERIGAADTVRIGPATYPFVDLVDGKRWTLDLGHGRIPWWILWPSRRVPGTTVGDYWRSRRLMSANTDSTVAAVLGGTGVLYERFWKPFAVAVLNTEPETAAATLLKPVVRETLSRGGRACRPVLARRGLGYSFAEPAVAYLRGRGADVRFACGCKEIVTSDNRIRALRIAGGRVELDADDLVISALPPLSLRQLLPAFDVPDDFRPIVNAHFKVSGLDRGLPPITGIIGGLAEWLFVKGDIASVTVSAAADAVGSGAEVIADRIWSEIAPLLGKSGAALPPYRIIKEKRATIAQTPAMLGRRQGAKVAIHNLLLAGDWTDTGLPATIEGAVRSGHRAAALALNA